MFPADLRYTPEHEWALRQGDSVIRFGITSYATEQLGDVVFVQLPVEGGDVTAGEPCGEVESTKSVSDLYAPVTGRVAGVNADLEDTPELVNTDPYGQGWMVDVDCGSVDETDSAWDALLSAEQYESGLS